MAGVITDLIDRVSDSSTGRPIIATLAAPGKAIAAASINLDAATNWTTSSAIHFSIYETTTIGSVTVKDSSTQTDWKGTLSGTAVSNLTITGGTDRAYTAGAKVEITPTARYAKDLYDWAMVGHNQNGTHKAFTESNIVPTAAIQDSAVDATKLAAGIPVQVVSAVYSAVSTGTSVIPNDDTVPQNTEGFEVMTLAITPKSTTNKLLIEAVVYCSNGNATQYLAAALFQDATASALAATQSFQATATAPTTIPLAHTMTAGTTSATTFKIRIGSHQATTTTFNGQAGTRVFGGVTKSFVKITEYKA